MIKSIVQLLAWLLGAICAAVAVWAAVVLMTRAPDPLYRLDGVDVALLVVAVTLILGGAVGLFVARRPDVAVPMFFAAALALFGLLAILSVGIVFLVASALPAVVAARRMGRGPPGSATSVLAATSAALGLSLALLAWPHGPFVECREGGGSTSGRWRDSGGSARVESRPDGSSHGTVSFNGEAYRYRCGADGELIEVERLR